MHRGKVIVFALVLGPSLVYGLGVVAIDNEEEVKEFIAADLANKINSYEFHPILTIVPGT